jgi:ATP-binding cassette subfamily C protein CydC
VSALLRIGALWRGRWPSLTLGAAVALASALVTVALMAAAGNRVATAVGAAGLAMAGGVMLRLLGAGRVVLRYLERLFTHDATFRALGDLRVWFFRGLAVRAAGGLGFRRAGDMLARLVNDIEALDALYLRIFIPLLGALVLLPLLVIVIGRRSLVLAAIEAGFFLSAALLLPWWTARGALRGGVRQAEAMAGLRVAALDALSGIREVRAFGAEGRMLALVQARQARLFAAQHAQALRLAYAGAGAFLAAAAALFAVLLATPLLGVASVLILFLTMAAFEAIAGLPRAGALAGHAAAAAARVLGAAEAVPALADPISPAAPPRGHALRFEAITFGWQPDRPAVFEGLTLDVPEGAHVAVLGPSGAGKSTLAALALKVAAPQAGRVLLGGVDIATLAAGELRQRIGWLGQTTHLFDDTIRANLLLARPAADEAALWAALDAARIAETVRALPDRLDTWVGEGGTRFSGGQGRRLALARALLSPAPLLILDEPCAGLDAATERAFLATLNDAAAGRSVLLITHRLTGVERLDRIWRLSGGKAVAAAG